jgi:A/G-specific adenine glycosylase
LNLKFQIQNSRLEKLTGFLLDWFAANARDLPWRRTCDPYAIWVSEIMLQQTQVKTVIAYWERWMRELPTIQAAARASPDKIHKLWEGLGYYARARNLQKAARQIVEQHDGKFPENFADVLALPGIGRYTAGAICSIAFNQPVPVLDGNVIRVLTRIFGISENPGQKETNARLWKLAEKLVTHASRLKSRTRTRTKDEDDLTVSRLNQSLMELGAVICAPRQPRCFVCPVKRFCVAFREKRAEELPNLGKRSAAIPRHFLVFVIEQRGRFLIRQRPAGVVNAHFWEFPNVEVAAGGTPAATALAEAAARVLGFQPERLTPLGTVKHSITRYRLTLEAYYVKTGRADVRRRGSGRWVTPAGLQRLAFAGAHRKILNSLNLRASKESIS